LKKRRKGDQYEEYICHINGFTHMKPVSNIIYYKIAKIMEAKAEPYLK
jgi:hypothetical protein